MLLISREQKAIIRRICKEQEASFLRILETRVEQIKNELAEDGYEVSESDILEELAKELEQWDKAKEKPETFVNVLDDHNISMVKHHLVNMYDLDHKESKPIWKKIGLYENLKENQN